MKKMTKNSLNTRVSVGISGPRWDGLDALRACAMLWMTVFHFSFDLSHAGLWPQNFYTDPFWTWQRTCILSLFLLCAGAGQALAQHQGQSWSMFWRRWGQIAAAALLVSAGSALMFPQSSIYFGVLHGIAVMLVVVRLTLHWGRWLWLAGLLAVASKFIASYAISTGAMPLFFNEKMWNWLGWISVLPVTEDYVPVFPWLGVMWWGAAAMGWWLARSASNDGTVALPRLPALMRRRLMRPLAVLGRYSLSYYLVHQPVLLAVVALLGMV
jgi:uncharacterized membrane protein